ncbi:disease resistance protein Roq1 isoform X1 [Cryptomeria japonica]|uniref:disease resistance protein Roq1 isoform X1 n=1 Tax=Cryptomeria japonica TaxID=3369 RepID=UPI0027DA0C7B|nr:disease resistance protein Roq1 isoform X1 [Cryptomeria japonica]XP_059076085.1 disease resistance protein Roq1 isoform X1 [Cryptomeria japonica]
MAASSSSSEEKYVTHQDCDGIVRKRAPAYPKSYDVFISHRGPDVKETLAKQIYESLRKSGYRAFLDAEETQGGECISCTIQDVICSSCVQIAIFSRGFAESKWCLDELVLMLQQTEALFIPVFYQVEPSELRHIDQGSYAKAFSQFKSKGRYLDKLEQWKTALHSASHFAGFELKKHNNNLCQRIVAAAVKEIQKRKPLYVAKHPVGLTELVEDFERNCGQAEEEEVKLVGIFGLGGCGKTTLAKEFFNSKRSDYNASCFLDDVREATKQGKLQLLQSQLLKELLDEDRKFANITEGINYLRHRLSKCSSSHFLIIIDDIDHPDQLDALLTKVMLSPGSLVIVTTRDQRVLIRADINICYNVKGMDIHHANELFCWHAFHQPYPTIGYEDLVQSFVQFCGGLPLSLKVLGAHVYGSNKSYWQLELNKVRKILPHDIMQRLKISFDDLDNEEKQIFMDIACFFLRTEGDFQLFSSSRDKDVAIRIWKWSGWSAEHALKTLQDKCLVELLEDGVQHTMWELEFPFRMHDHLRDLGRQMADELGPPRLWQHQILRSMEEEGFRKLLEETNSRCFHSFWDSSMGCRIRYFKGNLSSSAEKSNVLLWLQLDGVLKSIPSWIPLWQLHGLTVDGPVEQLWSSPLQSMNSLTVLRPLEQIWTILLSMLHGFSVKGLLEQLWSIPQQKLQIQGSQNTNQHSDTQASFQLRELELNNCPSLQRLPDLIGMLNHLEVLQINESFKITCTEGRSFSQSLRKLSSLRRLLLRNVSLIGELGLNNSSGSTHCKSCTSNCLNSLQILHFDNLPLSKLLISTEICPILESLKLSRMYNLAEVDLKLVTTLNFLSLYDCGNLKTISGLANLTGLESLFIDSCKGIRELPSLAHLPCLEHIKIRECNELQSMAGIEELKGLKSLVIEVHHNRDVGVWNCICGLKRLPSELTIILREAVDEAASRLNANLFCGLIGADEVGEIHISENGILEVSLEMRPSLAVINICVLLVTSNRAYLEGIGHTLLQGEWLVTILHTGAKEMYHHGKKLDDSQVKIRNAVVHKGLIATVSKGEEWKALSAFKRIIEKLYL